MLGAAAAAAAGCVFVFLLVQVNHTPYSIFFAARQSLHAKGPGGQGGLVAVRGSNTGTLTVVTFDAPSELCEVVITTGEISDFVDTTLVR